MVDEAILREMVANEEDITKVVTTYVDNMFKLFFIDLDTPTWWVLHLEDIYKNTSKTN